MYWEKVPSAPSVLTLEVAAHFSAVKSAHVLHSILCTSSESLCWQLQAKGQRAGKAWGVSCVGEAAEGSSVVAGAAVSCAGELQG